MDVVPILAHFPSPSFRDIPPIPVATYSSSDYYIPCSRERDYPWSNVRLVQGEPGDPW